MARFLLSLILVSVWFSAAGQDWQWARDGGSNYNVSFTQSIATDGAGNSYVVGNFANAIYFGTTTLMGGFDGNVFFIKYDNNGGLVWAKKISGTSVVEAIGVAAGADGYTYMTGNFKGTAVFGAFTLTSPDDRSAFVAKFDPSGNVVWARQTNSSEGEVKGGNIAVDGSGNTYVTGNFLNSARFGSVTITATKDERLFIAKYDANGNVVWVKMAGGLGSCFTHDITTDNNGHLYLTGQFWFTATFGAITLTNYSSVLTPADIFLAKYDANGNALWAKQAGGTDGDDVASAITVDASGNSYITGYFQTRATFGTTTITGNAAGNVFLAKYNTAGALQWVKKQESATDARGTGIGRDSNGNLYVVGHFAGSVAFGSTILTSYGNYDMFFAKYDANGNATAAVQSGGTGLDIVKKLDVNANGGIYFTGEIEGPVLFGATTLTKNIVVGKLNSIGYAPEPAASIGAVVLHSTTLCAGTTAEVMFATTGRFGADNVFTAQLSNSSGSFSSPTTIGSGKASPIAAAIPVSIAAGTGYRIRVFSSSPEKTGADNGANLTIVPSLQQPKPISGNTAVCVASLQTYTVPSVAGATTYTWEVPDGWTITGGQGTTTLRVVAGATAGAIGVTASNSCHPSAKRELLINPKVLSVTAAVTSPAIAAGSSTFLSAKGATTYKWEPAAGLSNPNIANPVATPTQTTTYTVTGYKDGCSETAQVTVTVKSGVNPSNWVWATQGGNHADAIIATKAIATDTEGNVYMTGDFRGEVSFGNITLKAPGNIKTFVVKYTPQGEVVWAREGTSGVSHVTSEGITTDGNSNVYVAGEFSSYLLNNNKPSTVTFNATTLTAGTENSEIYITKYDKDGNLVWLKSAGGASEDKVKSIAADGEGNFYITGSYYSESRFGAYTVNNTNTGTGAFIARYNPQGVAVWANRIDTGIGIDVSVDANGDAVVGGHYFAGTDGPFVAKYTKSGSASWMKRMVWGQHKGGPFVVSGIALDKQNNAYITGGLNGSLDFGEFSITADYNGIFLAKFDAQGKALWAVTEGVNQAGSTKASDIAVGRDGNIYLTGPATYLPEQDAWYMAGAFLTKYSPLGRLIGANVITVRGDAYGIGSYGNKGAALAIDNLNNIYLTGAFKNEIDLSGSMSLLTAGQEYWHQSDFFLAKARAVAPLPTPTITIGSMPSTYSPCPWQNIDVPFTSSGRFHSGNVFNAYLLDKNGKSLGIIGSSTKSPVQAQLPQGIQSGEKYTIKVLATGATTVAGNNEKAISFSSVPQTGDITGNQNVCIYRVATYSVPAQLGAEYYTWTLPPGWQFTSSINATKSTVEVIAHADAQEGYITVRVTTQCGTSEPKKFFVKVSNEFISPKVESGIRCSPGSVTLKASGAPEGAIYKWYLADQRTQVGSGPTYTTPVLTEEVTTYYASITLGSCEGAKVPGLAFIQPNVTMTAGPDETVCSVVEELILTDYSVTTSTESSTWQGIGTERGTWSGIGVTARGIFYPSAVGPGVYDLTYTYNSPYNCLYSDTKTVTVSNCLGIPESKAASKLIVYPNPTKSDVLVELPLPSPSSVTLRIYDTKGQAIYEQRYPKMHGDFKQVLSLKNRAKGLYLLQLILQDGVITRRIVLE